MENDLYSRSSVWLEDAQGKVVFGLGRYRILKAVDRLGSLNAAAKEMKMGYRAVWARINATEKRLGQKLLEKKTGGKSGGGSQLTPLAEELISRFDKVRAGIERKTDALFSKEFGDQLSINPDKS